MRGLNRVDLIGNLGNDPDFKYLSSGDPVCNFSLAVTEGEKTEWINVVAYKKVAELIAEYLKKGSKTFVSGRIRTRSWSDQSGVKKYATEVIANEVIFLDSKGSSPAPASPVVDDDDLPF